MIVQALKRAKELISDPSHWIQGHYAKDEDGAVVAVNDKRACCFCAEGAVRKAGNPVGTLKCLDEAASELGGCSMSIISFNDSPDTTHEDVMRAFDLAIEKAEAKWGQS